MVPAATPAVATPAHFAGTCLPTVRKVLLKRTFGTSPFHTQSRRSVGVVPFLCVPDLSPTGRSPLEVTQRRFGPSGCAPLHFIPSFVHVASCRSRSVSGTLTRRMSDLICVCGVFFSILSRITLARFTCNALLSQSFVEGEKRGNISHVSYAIFESLQPVSTKIHNDVCQCNSCWRHYHLGSNWGQWSRREGTLYLSRSKHRCSTSWCREELSVIVSRPALADYGMNVLWVAALMEHARGATQAQPVSAALAPRWDRDGDVYLGAVVQGASSRAANSQELSLLCGISKENAPSLQLAVTGTGLTC